MIQRGFIGGSRALAAAAIVVLQMSLTAFAQEQKQSLTLQIGSAPAGTMVGDIVEVPVTIESGASLPSIVILFIEFDDTLLEYRSARLGESVPEDKILETFLDDGEGESLASLSLIAFGFDQVVIGDGTLFVIEFEVLDGGVSGVVPLVAADSSATTPGPDITNIVVIAHDGGIDLSCTTLDTPGNLNASSNRSDGVFLSWNAVDGAAEYRVFRGPGNATSPEEAAPITDWISATEFLDSSAPRAMTADAFGCAVEAVTVRYWVRARERELCESNYGGPASGERAAPAAKATPASTIPVENAALNFLALFAAPLFFLLKRRNAAPVRKTITSN